MDGTVADGVYRDRLVAALAFGDDVVEFNVGAQRAETEGADGWVCCLLPNRLFLLLYVLLLDPALHARMRCR